MYVAFLPFFFEKIPLHILSCSEGERADKRGRTASNHQLHGRNAERLRVQGADADAGPSGLGPGEHPQVPGAAGGGPQDGEHRGGPSGSRAQARREHVLRKARGAGEGSLTKLITSLYLFSCNNFHFKSELSV